MNRLLTLCVFCLGLLSSVVFGAQPAVAHALQPGYLELQYLDQDIWRIYWRVPDVAGRPMELQAVLPENCQVRSGPSPEFDGSAWVSQWISRCPAGLEGGTVQIDGLAATSTDVLVRYELQAGQGESQRLTGQQASFQLPEQLGPWKVLTSYLSLGFDHILGGVDHLMFVFALLLLIRDRWQVLGAITAFTAAHSVTLAAAALG